MTSISTPIAAGETRQRDALMERFADRISVNPDLSRALVSWQSNRAAPGFRWFKFKEGFSVALVRYLAGFLTNPGLLLDPFAGTGVAPITAAGAGWNGVGIELLPVGIRVANGILAAAGADPESFRRQAGELLEYTAQGGLAAYRNGDRFPHIRITEKAFTADGENAIAAARQYLRKAAPGTTPPADCAICLAQSAKFLLLNSDGRTFKCEPIFTPTNPAILTLAVNRRLPAILC